jgi:DNA helicase-2/ATP-dependent DNA helicase PcrA
MKGVSISPEDIKEAECCLLAPGEAFDLQERVPFIRNLETCDLLAVPGSGKTTALLAKLICLEKKLPFADGSGILVLAHTNAAVDEITEKLRPICPKLLDYPNFIGTVQGFINRFLVIPFCRSYLGNAPFIFDDHRFSEALSWEFKRISMSERFNKPYFHFYGRFLKDSIIESIDKEATTLSPKQIKKLVSELCKKANQKVDDTISRINESAKSSVSPAISKEKFNSVYSKKVDMLVRSLIVDYSTCGIFSTEGSHKNVASWKIPGNKRAEGIKHAIEEVLKRGIVSFPFTYQLAKDCLNKYDEKIVRLISKRFGFVFVDEAQDLDENQLDIIDKVFLHSSSTTRIQRIGDKNQAIYSSGTSFSVHCNWKTRGETTGQAIKDMVISGSKRLTAENAAIVDLLVLDRTHEDYKVVGTRVLKNAIKPHLLVFGSGNKDKVIDRFLRIIKDLQTKEAIPLEPKHPFKVIAWNTIWNNEPKDSTKLRLEDFCDYSKEEKARREHYAQLSQYLHFCDRSTKSMGTIHKSLMNALCEVLNRQGLRHSAEVNGKKVQRYYRPADFEVLIRAIDKESAGVYDQFRGVLYKATLHIAKSEMEEAYQTLTKFINSEISQWLGIIPSQELVEFIGTFQSYPAAIPNKKEGVLIGAGTIHSVKGQTHCATMYIETSFHKYETQHVPTGFFGDGHGLLLSSKDKKGSEEDVRAKQALKMLYVGFSRPTHLLCFAVLEENVKDSLQKFYDAGWEIDAELGEFKFEPGSESNGIGSDLKP